MGVYEMLFVAVFSSAFETFLTFSNREATFKTFNFLHLDVT